MAFSRKHNFTTGLQARVWGYTHVSTLQQSGSGISLDEQQRRITARRCLTNEKPRSDRGG